MKGKEETQKKKPFAVRFLLTLIRIVLFLLLGIIAALVIWFAWSALDKRNSLDYLPEDFYVYVHTDRIYESLEPVVDLEATDVILGKSGEKLRGAFMTVRSFKYRDNFFVKKALNRRADAAVYSAGNSFPFFCGVVDLGFLSAATRLSSFIVPVLNIENLSYDQTEGYAEFRMKNMNLYIKPVHNLVIVSNNKDLFDKAIEGKADYTVRERSLIESKSENAIRVFASPSSLLADFGIENAALKDLSSLINADSLAEVSFSITDKDIKLGAELPLEVTPERTEAMPVLRNSTVPKLVPSLTENIQYYTLLNAGSLEELKTSAFPYLRKQMNIDNLWNQASLAVKTLTGATVDDVLFSWTGNEIAVLGIEGQNDPVFAMEVKDEKNRRKVFDTVLNSLILTEDDSLILDGVRLSQINLPNAIQALLNAFDVNLTLPYYMVKDKYIYFSQSAECLAGINTALERGLPKLSDNENYKKISSSGNIASLLSLYYNTEHSRPFFLRGNSKVASVLGLYPTGKCDVSIRNSSLILSLSATSENAVKLFEVPGFPKKLEGKNDGYLCAGTDGKKEALFWIENKNTVMSMELPSTSLHSLVMNENSFAVPCVTEDKDGFICWTVTSSGVVYLFDSKLEIAPSFPIETSSPLVSRPVSLGDSLLFTGEDGRINIVNKDGSLSFFSPETENNKVSGLSALKNKKDGLCIALYDKGFLGQILLINETKNETDIKKMSVTGIGFGSPALLLKKNDVYSAFITQGGELSIWKNGDEESCVNIQIDDVFDTNVKAGDSCFYALGKSGMLYRISLDGTVLDVKCGKISGSTASFLNVVKASRTEDEKILVCSDSNVVYGFDGNLELLYGFPVTGFGQGAFADVNGDGVKDYFALSIDNKIYSYNVR